MSNDDIIIGEIHAALERHPGIPHPAEVAVSSREGTVTLRGSVGSIAMRSHIRLAHPSSRVAR